MNTVPNPAIDTAVQAIRAFGGDLTGFQAAQVLPMWTSYPKLTEPDIIEIIARFGPARCRFCGEAVEHDGTQWRHIRQVDMEVHVVEYQRQRPAEALGIAGPHAGAVNRPHSLVDDLRPSSQRVWTVSVAPVAYPVGSPPRSPVSGDPRPVRAS